MAAARLVLKLHGAVTDAQLALAHAYSQAGDLTLLYDQNSSSSDSAVAELRVLIRSTLPASVRLCTYSWDSVSEAFPMMDKRYRALSKLRRNSGLQHLYKPKNVLDGPPLIILMRRGKLDGCKRDADRRPVWTLEADAAFTGDVLKFFAEFEADKTTDLLSTGFSLGDKRWWAHSLSTLETKLRFNHSSFVRTLGPLPQPVCNVSRMWRPPNETALRERGLSDLEAYQIGEYYVDAVQADLRSAPGQCESSRLRDQSGHLFRLMHVERLSARLLDVLGALLDDGRFTVAESFAPSACALMPWCVLGDWGERGPTRPQEDGSEEEHAPRTVGVLGASGFRGAQCVSAGSRPHDLRLAAATSTATSTAAATTTSQRALRACSRGVRHATAIPSRVACIAMRGCTRCSTSSQARLWIWSIPPCAGGGSKCSTPARQGSSGSVRRTGDRSRAAQSRAAWRVPRR